MIVHLLRGDVAAGRQACELQEDLGLAELIGIGIVTQGDGRWAPVGDIAHREVREGNVVVTAGE